MVEINWPFLKYVGYQNKKYNDVGVVKVRAFIQDIYVAAKHFSLGKSARYQHLWAYVQCIVPRGSNRAKMFLTFYKVTAAFRHGRPRHVEMTKADGNKNQLRRVSAVPRTLCHDRVGRNDLAVHSGTTTIGRAAAFGFRRTITGRRVPDTNFIPPSASHCLKPKARTKAGALSYFCRGA